MAQDEQNWGKFLGFGIEMFVGIVLGFFAGNWLDRRFGWAPWGMILCSMFGLASGMYPLIKEGLRSNKD